MGYFKDSKSLSVPWWMCVQTPIDTTGIFKHAEMLILEARVQLNACQKTIRNRQKENKPEALKKKDFTTTKCVDSRATGL